ncbi:hypothetical protein HU200_056288 [Digitaria exilis]|uniref:Dirigent protein n=1 Tax=Digitaria exilis TaxID=1010633 RepID=A0A835AHW0_9POAL|nr:hypothetical protein HU200_056288 [Digitaria exilis]
MLAVSIAVGHALDEKTLSTTLYLQQTFDQDQRTLATDTVIINWVLKDGPDAGANTIGHAEGLTTHANLAKNWWVTIMDMVFDGGRASESVMGGTGELTVARGIINYNIIRQDNSRIFELCIDVYYTSPQSILVSNICIFISGHYRNFC